MTYGEIIDRERPRNIKDTISKDEKEIIELYKDLKNIASISLTLLTSQFDISPFSPVNLES